MTHYDTEQGSNSDPDASKLVDDLTPFLRSEWGLDAFVEEFPYNQYAGVDFDATEDDDVQYRLNQDYTSDNVRALRDYTIKRGPYRTDLVGVDVDRQALATRIRRLGHYTPLNQSRSGKRKYRRTYLSFVADGPMSRDYWETEHSREKTLGEGAVRGYSKSTARPAFGWLKKRDFLAPVGGGMWDAVDVPLHIHGRTHAFELKLARNEWDTALEQAERARVFADYRWTVLDAASADAALANADAFRDAGVGLITVHPEDGVEIDVWAEQCTPEVDRTLLDRYNVERWDLNERILTKLETKYEKEQDPDVDADRWNPNTPNILGALGVENLETDAEPPTAHGHTASEVEDEPDTSPPDASEQHKPLTAFSDGGES